MINTSVGVTEGFKEEFNKIDSFVNKYYAITEELINLEIEEKLLDKVYDDYKQAITSEITEKFRTFALNLLNSKYKYLVKKIKYENIIDNNEMSE